MKEILYAPGPGAKNKINFFLSNILLGCLSLKSLCLFEIEIAPVDLKFEKNVLPVPSIRDFGSYRAGPGDTFSGNNFNFLFYFPTKLNKKIID